MAQRSHVPKFGNWESEENVPYTAYFDKARKGKGGGGKMINPNDPEDNPDFLSDDNNSQPQVEAPPSRNPGVEPEVPVVRPRHERRTSREDGGDGVGGRRGTTTESSHQRQHGVSSGDTPKRAARHSGGSDRSVEQSPLHPHYQPKVGGGGRGGGSGSGSGVSSPSWERRVSEGSHGGVVAPNTPGRTRFGRGDETPDKGAAVPKFGEWDESNPASADGYTHIFNKVREEKHSGTAKVPIITTENAYYNSSKQENRNNSGKCCCFSWSK